MNDPDNRDKIKEMLEGHNKKFTTTELVVGIIVLLIIGAGIGYAVFKILTPASQPGMKVITTPVEQPVNQVNAPETSSVPSEQVANNTISNSTSNNAVAYNVNSNMQQKEKSTSQTSENETNKQPGPEIIPPQPQTGTSQVVIQKKVKKIIHQSQQSVSTRQPEKTNVISEKKEVLPEAKHKVHHYVKKHKKRRGLSHKNNKNRYVLQVSSNKDRKFAILTVIKLRKCGHNAYTKEVEVKGVKYTRVYVGPIAGYSAAKEEAKNIKRQLHLKYLPIIKRDD